MKKILIVSPSLSMGGQEKMLVTLSNLLSRNGYDVTVVIYNPFFDLKGELDSGVELIYRSPKKHLGKKIPYIRHEFYDYGLWETRASARRLYRHYVGDNKYDVEIAFFRGRAVKIISGSTNPDSRKIAWVHSDFTQCEGIGRNFKGMDAVKKAYSVFDRIVCVSEPAEKAFNKVIGLDDKTVTIPNCIPVNDIKEKSKALCGFGKKRFTVMSVGRLHKAKGYDRLVKACASLKKAGTPLDLVIIGKGEEEEKLRSLAAELDYPNLTLLGQQDNPYCYVKNADLYVCSSLYEGFNLTIAEALVLGVPVLSTECSGPCEILDNGEYGMIVENSEDGLYNGILKLIQNPKLLEKYKAKSTERTEFFDEDSYLRKIEKLF